VNTMKDIDGNNITSLLLCFFLYFLPELIEGGYVYKAMPPLYLMEEKSLKKYYKGRPWLYDKWEYYNLYHDIIADNVDLFLEDTTPDMVKKNRAPKWTDPCVKQLSKKETVRWLNKNSEYLLELGNLRKRASASTSLLERVCYYKVIFQNEQEFGKHIVKLYPECAYDIINHSIKGSIDGRHETLICDELFMRNASRYMKQMMKNHSIYVWYREKGSKAAPKRCSIGEFLTIAMASIKLKIEQRFKGLGEAEPSLLFMTTTNPKLRKLYRITIEDIKYAKDIFELLHGKSADLREQRRALLDSAEISYADIDN